MPGARSAEPRRRGPQQLRLRVSTLRLGPVCRVMNTATGQFASNRRINFRSAATPPAEAPIAMMVFLAVTHAEPQRGDIVALSYCLQSEWRQRESAKRADDPRLERCHVQNERIRQSKAARNVKVARCLLSMEERPETFRQKAAEMRQRAKGTADLVAKLTYAELAEQWEELARAVEQLQKRW